MSDGTGDRWHGSQSPHSNHHVRHVIPFDIQKSLITTQWKSHEDSRRDPRHHRRDIFVKLQRLPLFAVPQHIVKGHGCLLHELRHHRAQCTGELKGNGISDEIRMIRPRRDGCESGVFAEEGCLHRSRNAEVLVCFDLIGVLGLENDTGTGAGHDLVIARLFETFLYEVQGAFLPAFHRIQSIEMQYGQVWRTLDVKRGQITHFDEPGYGRRAFQLV